MKADTLVTFSVDMGTNIANLTFTPGTDTVSVHGSFAGWGAGTNLVQEGGGTVYTNTVDDTTDANGAVMTYKYVNSHLGYPNGGYESLSDGNNRAAILPSVSGSSLVLPTPFFGDAGAPTFINTVTFQVDMSQQINLGAFTNGGPNASTVTANGTYNNWTGAAGILTNDPSIIVTNILPNLTQVVTSNVFVGTFMETNSPYQNMGYKFVQNGTYEGTLKLNDGGNRFYTGSNNTPAIMPIVFFNDAPFAPPCQVAFQVDMSLVVLTDTNFNPASVTINGDVIAPNGWGGTPCTNDPTAANTNIYTVNVAQVIGQGATATYQYRYTARSTGNITYDHLNGANGGQGNRTFVAPQVSGTNVLVVFNDASYDDYLLQPTPVFFSVNMSNAVEYPTATPFNPSTDNVYVNGAFLGWYAWGGGINPAPAPAGTRMFPEGSTLIYTNTQILPAGSTADMIYKYGIDPAGANNGPLDDEAATGINHQRVARATAFDPYVLPTDTFGYQYVEPYFNVSSNWAGNLTVGRESGGSVPVTWLGRPGARLQVASNVTGAWQTIVATDGTNWTIGFSSTNGFVSETNYPTSGTGTFFRLIKP